MCRWFLFIVLFVGAHDATNEAIRTDPESNAINDAFKSMSKNCFDQPNCEECAASFQNSIDDTQNAIFKNFDNPFARQIQSTMSSASDAMRRKILDLCDSLAHVTDQNSDVPLLQGFLSTEYSAVADGIGVFLTTAYSVAPDNDSAKNGKSDSNTNHYISPWSQFLPHAYQKYLTPEQGHQYFQKNKEHASSSLGHSATLGQAAFLGQAASHATALEASDGGNSISSFMERLRSLSVVDEDDATNDKPRPEFLIMPFSMDELPSLDLEKFMKRPLSKSLLAPLSQIPGVSQVPGFNQDEEIFELRSSRGSDVPQFVAVPLQSLHFPSGLKSVNPLSKLFENRLADDQWSVVPGYRFGTGYRIGKDEARRNEKGLTDQETNIDRVFYGPWDRTYGPVYSKFPWMPKKAVDNSVSDNVSDGSTSKLSAVPSKDSSTESGFSVSPFSGPASLDAEVTETKLEKELLRADVELSDLFRQLLKKMESPEGSSNMILIGVDDSVFGVPFGTEEEQEEEGKQTIRQDNVHLLKDKTTKEDERQSIDERMMNNDFGAPGKYSSWDIRGPQYVPNPEDVVHNFHHFLTSSPEQTLEQGRLAVKKALEKIGSEAQKTIDSGLGHPVVHPAGQPSDRLTPHNVLSQQWLQRHDELSSHPLNVPGNVVEAQPIAFFMAATDGKVNFLEQLPSIDYFQSKDGIAEKEKELTKEAGDVIRNYWKAIEKGNCEEVNELFSDRRHQIRNILKKLSDGDQLSNGDLPKLQPRHLQENQMEIQSFSDPLDEVRFEKVFNQPLDRSFFEGSSFHKPGLFRPPFHMHPVHIAPINRQRPEFDARSMPFMHEDSMHEDSMHEDSMHEGSMQPGVLFCIRMKDSLSHYAPIVHEVFFNPETHHGAATVSFPGMPDAKNMLASMAMDTITKSPETPFSDIIGNLTRFAKQQVQSAENDAQSAYKKMVRDVKEKVDDMQERAVDKIQERKAEYVDKFQKEADKEIKETRDSMSAAMEKVQRQIDDALQRFSDCKGDLVCMKRVAQELQSSAKSSTKVISIFELTPDLKQFQTLVHLPADDQTSSSFIPAVEASLLSGSTGASPAVLSYAILGGLITLIVIAALYIRRPLKSISASSAEIGTSSAEIGTEYYRIQEP